MESKEVLRKEVEQLSEGHAEQVLQHVRELRAVPESSDSGAQRRPTQLDVSEPEVDLVWYCAACDSEFPRPLDDPSTCPGCGAPREDLTLRESERRAA